MQLLFGEEDVLPWRPAIGAMCTIHVGIPPSSPFHSRSDAEKSNMGLLFVLLSILMLRAGDHVTEGRPHSIPWNSCHSCSILSPSTYTNICILPHILYTYTPTHPHTHAPTPTHTHHTHTHHTHTPLAHTHTHTHTTHTHPHTHTCPHTHTRTPTHTHITHTHPLHTHTLTHIPHSTHTHTHRAALEHS